MKKRIDCISLNKDTLNELIVLLKSPSFRSADRQELLDALTDMQNGHCSFLMLERQDTETVPAEQNVLRHAELTIYGKSRKVLLSGQEIFLTPKEFDILFFLAKNKGEVFTKEQIYQAVWDSEYFLDESNIMAFIRKLRKKIEPDPDNPQYILTIWGIGYKFGDSVN